ncbi:MAG: hypothetical protein AAFU64_02650 [Bacteroidota bacterium]
MPKKENILARAWAREEPPQKALLIRVEALGDTFATFPFVSHLREKFPHLQIDLLIREDMPPSLRN